MEWIWTGTPTDLTGWSWMDALFTATSAVTIIGLSVVNRVNHLIIFKFIILVIDPKTGGLV